MKRTMKRKKKLENIVVLQLLTDHYLSIDEPIKYFKYLIVISHHKR